jgi:hypothetical protein
LRHTASSFIFALAKQAALTPLMKTKHLLIALTFIFATTFTNAQTLYDYKVKNASNAKARTAILNKLRDTLYGEYKQKFVFTINKLNVCNDYAWFEGNAARADGKEIVLPENNDYDCCHVECLLQRKKGIWYIVEVGSFSTDVWYEGIWDRHKAPRKLYGRGYGW